MLCKILEVQPCLTVVAHSFFQSLLGNLWRLNIFFLANFFFPYCCMHVTFWSNFNPENQQIIN